MQKAASKADPLTQVEKIVKYNLAHLQANQPLATPHTPPRAEPQSVEDTPKTPTGLGHSKSLDFFIPNKSREEPEGKGKSVKVEPSPGPSHLLRPKQTGTHHEPEFFPSPTTVEELPREPHAHKPSASIPATSAYAPPCPQETAEEREARMMENLATAIGRAVSVPLISALMDVTQTPGSTTPKSKVPSPEKFDGKKGPAAKSFILDCNTYFLGNPSCFQTDHICISFVLMNLKKDNQRSGMKSTWKNSLMASQNPFWLIGTHLKLLFCTSGVTHPPPNCGMSPA
ncbi:hypothetical protein OPQ81_002473 [Rhizoctonia solani]|nr:hypothetical protein OPQ81_002473 [Rhizoctonia solani]